ncbi:colicin V secretion ABC transporter ATP-binding protein [Xanthomonas axonopodis Xac29-1]|nr:colicin V secretion ABC transporter ATP-binding protein [Xanthomonas axonopodis Xac29-1]
MTAKFFLNQALLPSPDILRAFGDQMMEGLLLFRADGKLILANAIARQSLCKEDPTDDRNLGERISQVLPSDALNQARSKGSWTGSLPVADRVVIAHLYYNEECGPGHFLALFHNIEGQQDYERELQQRHAELRQAYLRLNGAQDKLLQSEKMASIGQLAAGVAHEINNPIGYVLRLKRVLIQIFALALAIEALGLSIPLQAQWAVDQISESNGKVILTVAAIFSLVIIIQAGLNLARAWLISWLGANISTQWVINIFSHLMRLPLDFFEKRHLGDIMSRFGSIHWIQAILTGSFVTALLDGLTGSLALVLLFIYSTGMATVAVAVATLYALGRFLMFGALWRASEQSMVFDARQQSELMESVRGIQAIKLANRQLERRARLANATLEAAKRGITAERIKLGFGAASQGIFGLQRVFLLSAGAYLISRNAMTAGMMVAALSYADQFSIRVGSLIDNAVELKMLGLHLNRLADITTADEEPARGRLEGALRSAPEVQVKGLGYRYSEWEPWIFRNLSFTIAPGQSVALVGPSGCGKTTLAKIVLGLIAPQEGEVTVTDQPSPVCRSAIPAEGMAAVMQDDCLFSGTIADNVAFFDSSAELSKIEAAARAAGIHDDIVKMPMGYETLVGDMGSTLSGGQKQRILLARALYTQPKILVLDEATSHLDSKNEKVVNDAVMDLEITRIIIAHREQTIAMADRVFDLSRQTWIR